MLARFAWYRRSYGCTPRVPVESALA